MRSLVVYDSQFGNTEHVAHVIAKALGEFGPARAAHIHETALTQLREVDLLIFGCPISSGNGISAMHDFIKRLPPEALRAPKTACFDTRLHTPRLLARFAAPQLAKQLKRIHVEPIAPPEGFFVKARGGPLENGEAERAAEWGRALARQAAATQVA